MSEATTPSFQFQSLGTSVRHPVNKLETFEAPWFVSRVTMKCLEFTSLCPVTGQPDFGTIDIMYVPTGLCIESKSMKLYLWQYREKGSFCESLAAEILDDVVKTIVPRYAKVVVHQAPRGGIGIDSQAEWPRVGSLLWRDVQDFLK